MTSITVSDLHLRYPLSARRLKTPPSGNASGRLLKTVSGRVHGVTALQDISFKIEQGERVALVGRNGSGKTSLLQALAGIYPPTQGRVAINGQVSAIVNVNLGLNPAATGRRNVVLRGLAAGQTRAHIEHCRPDIEAFCELGDFLDLPVETYSAGMRMRLSFAIATAFDADILVLDEWLAAGDEAFREKARDRMAKLIAHSGILVLASHSQPLLRSVCTRAIWLEDGRLAQDGPIDEVLEAYSAAVRGQNTSAKKP